MSCTEGLEKQEMTARNATETFNPAFVLGQMGEPHQSPYQVQFLYFSQKYTVSKSQRTFHCHLL